MMPIGFPLSETSIHAIADDARKDEASIFDKDHFRQQP
jgi:hypothetical protein